MLVSKTFHFIAWTVLVLAAVAALGWLLRDRAGTGTALARANAVAGPLMLALFWASGIIFNPPQNFRVAERYSFFGYWFQLHDASPER